MAPPDTRTSTLTRSPLLSGLPAEAVSDFQDAAMHGTFRRGMAVFAEGEEGDCVFLLIAGKIKVTRPGPDGRDVLFTMVGPGELLGELCAFDSGPRHATATAVRDTEVCWLAVPAMRDWLGRHPDAAMRMMHLLAARVRRANDRLEDATGVDVATRVARALLEQAGRFGVHTPLGLRFTLDLNQDELARHVCASRERVNQILGDYCRRGWLRQEGGEWIVLNAPALARRSRYRPETANRRPAVRALRPSARSNRSDGNDRSYGALHRQRTSS